VADWETISALATAGGTLVLAAATFSAVRSSNRSARVAERALLAGMRPLLVPSLSTDPDQKVLWRGGRTAVVGGGRAVAVHDDGVVYLAISMRNVGSGLALVHGWSVTPSWLGAEDPRTELDAFRRQIIDLYVPAGGPGYWEGALRDADDPRHAQLVAVIEAPEMFTIDVLYGDQDGGQRTISRYVVLPASDRGWYCQIVRHWDVDRADPR